MARSAPVGNMAATLSDIESGIFTRYFSSGTMMNSAYLKVSIISQHITHTSSAQASM